MKARKITALFLLFSAGLIAQKKDYKVFQLDGEYTKASEFRTLFRNQIDTTKTKEELEQEFQTNLKLMVDYKLKLNYATKHGYDTIRAIKNDLERYREQLAAPYLLDAETLAGLETEAYERSKTLVRASHILIKYASETDTIAAYEKISKIRKEALAGKNFEDLAVLHSEDPSAKSNKGDLGYFGPFRMVYPFESAAYNTPKGEISPIVKTSFGYHILKIADKKASKGRIEVAHIMLSGFTQAKQDTIKKIYQGLKDGGDFNSYVLDYSDDRNSKKNGGKLRPFYHGSSIPMNFQETAFALEKPGDFSDPVKTHVGWHIIQLIKKYPMESLEEQKKELDRKIKRDSRGKLPKEVAFERLKKELNVRVFEENLTPFKTKDVYNTSQDSLLKPLVIIGNDTVVQNDFKKYVYNRRVQAPISYYSAFEQKVIKDYYSANLEKTKPEFGTTVKNYKDGIIIFELMKNKVWDFVRKDTLGTKKYYESHPKLFEQFGKDKKYKDIRGHVQHEYQKSVEAKWMDSLRTALPAKYCRFGVKKLAKEYR